MENYETMHWHLLKKAVEAKGLTWKNKATAIRDLTAVYEFPLDKGDAAATNAAATDIVVSITPDELPALSTESRGSIDKGWIMLDRSLPFGSISGDVEECPTARYSQNGHLFDSAGKRLD
jgi:hypothetical protein